MTGAEKKWFWKAVLFAVGYELVLTVIGWLLIGRPQTMGAITTYKATLTIGLPMIAQVLDPRHQATMSLSGRHTLGMVWSIFSFLLFALTNGYYISQVARSVQERPGTPWADAKRATVPLLIWLVIQFALGIVTLPFMALNSFLGGAVSTVLLLTVRYWYVLLEYTVVVGGDSFGAAWKKAPRLRVLTFGAAARYFWIVMVLNLVLAYVVNVAFSVPTLLLFMVLNAVVSTWLQHRLMKHFFRALESFDTNVYTGIIPY